MPMTRRMWPLLVGAALLTSCGSDTEPTAAEMPVVAAEADYLEPASIEDLARRGTLVVRAVAGETEATTAGLSPDKPLPVTVNDMRVTKVIYGDAPPELRVAISGGQVTGHDGKPYLLEFPVEPQFRQGEEYLLVLHARPLDPSTYLVVGPAQGRYRVIAEDRLLPAQADRRSAAESGRGAYPMDPVQREMTSGTAAQAETRLQSAKRNSG